MYLDEEFQQSSVNPALQAPVHQKTAVSTESRRFDAQTFRSSNIAEIVDGDNRIVLTDKQLRGQLKSSKGIPRMSIHSFLE